MSESVVPSFVGGMPLQGGGERFETFNPATGQALASVWDATAADVETAVAGAQRGEAGSGLGELVDALIAEDQAERMAGLGE